MVGHTRTTETQVDVSDAEFHRITPSHLSQWSKAMDKSPSLSLARLVLSKSDPLEILIDKKAVVRDAKAFNLQLEGCGARGEYPGPRVTQGATGRCCIIALINVLRYDVIDQLNLGDFQLSASYLFFYDKLEGANHYLERNIIETRGEPIDSRIVTYLNQAPVRDGMHWDMLVNVVAKYGLLPNSLYSESFSSSASSHLNQILTTRLREYGFQLRANPDPQLKEKFMAEVFNILSITLGTPPKPDETVKWEYHDRDNQYRCWEGTPLEFYQQYCRGKGFDPEASVGLINDPRNDFEKVYEIERLGNVLGGRKVRHINAPIKALENAVVTAIRANTPIFFGCDVSKSSSRSLGILDTELYDLQAAFGSSSTGSLSKADRMRMGESRSTHALVITAVHLDEEGQPVRYKMENSWGEEEGDKGWFMMTAEWFREYAYLVVVPGSQVEQRWLDVVAKGETVMLPP